MSYNYYQPMIQANLTTLHQARAENKYQELFSLLDNKRLCIGVKLEQIHNYFVGQIEEHHGTICPRHYQYIKGEKWFMYECFASLDTLHDRYRGGKQGWSLTLLRLVYLGLLVKHVPSADAEYNSAEHIASMDRANSSKRPVTWYGIPCYTDKVLSTANGRAADALTIKGKDSLRDMAGAETANICTDTGYDIHAQTEQRRLLLYSAFADLMKKNGFCYDADVVKMAKSNCPSEHRWRMDDTWREYRPLLLRQFDLIRSRPTKAEQELFCLDKQTFIIRNR